MKKASDAFQETKSYKEIIEFKKNIETQIEKAISRGEYECEVSFSTYVPDSVRDKVRDELRELGYCVDLPKQKNKPLGCPLDQWSPYNVAKIGWNTDAMRG